MTPLGAAMSDQVFVGFHNTSTPRQWAKEARVLMAHLNRVKTAKAKRMILRKALDDAYGAGYADA